MKEANPKFVRSKAEADDPERPMPKADVVLSS